MHFSFSFLFQREPRRGGRGRPPYRRHQHGLPEQRRRRHLLLSGRRERRPREWVSTTSATSGQKWNCGQAAEPRVVGNITSATSGQKRNCGQAAEPRALVRVVFPVRDRQQGSGQGQPRLISMLDNKSCRKIRTNGLRWAVNVASESGTAKNHQAN